MFNTIQIRGGTQHVHSSVTEKRAPTDESVRILSEMETAAEKRVIERGNSRCKNTELEVHWIVMHDPFEPDVLQLHLFYKLNGRPRDFKVPVCGSRFMNPKEKFKLIHERVMKDIAETISFALFEDAKALKTITGQ